MFYLLEGSLHCTRQMEEEMNEITDKQLGYINILLTEREMKSARISYKRAFRRFTKEEASQLIEALLDETVDNEQVEDWLEQKIT